MIWGPMGPITRPKVPEGQCRCTCYCKEPATTMFMHGPNEWKVCARCKQELEEALIPWLQ